MPLVPDCTGRERRSSPIVRRQVESMEEVDARRTEDEAFESDSSGFASRCFRLAVEMGKDGEKGLKASLLCFGLVGAPLFLELPLATG